MAVILHSFYCFAVTIFKYMHTSELHNGMVLQSLKFLFVNLLGYFTCSSLVIFPSVQRKMCLIKVSIM